MPLDEVRAFYSTPGPLTALGRHAAPPLDPARDLAALCALVQGLVVHPFLAALYGLDPKALPADDLETRPAEAILDRVIALDPAPLDVPRPPDRRFAGNCRHHSVLLCAFLRARGVPARARCGFGGYFEAGRFVDHWVCEIWDETRAAWRLVDAQIDARQRALFGIDFDTTDVPRSAFLVAGDAWQRCRAGRADPERFGILDMWGLWFVRGNLVRDVASLAKRELLPWDGWGTMSGPGSEATSEELALLDHAAELTLAGDGAHRALLALYDTRPEFRVPRSVFSFARGAAADLGEAVSAPARALSAFSEAGAVTRARRSTDRRRPPANA